MGGFGKKRLLIMIGKWAIITIICYWESLSKTNQTILYNILKLLLFHYLVVCIMPCVLIYKTSIWPSVVIQVHWEIHSFESLAQSFKKFCQIES
jgi:hypothetical protein